MRYGTLTWQSWRRAAEPSHAFVLPLEDGATEPTPEEVAACSYAGRMRKAYRSIPVREREQRGTITGEAVVLARSRIRLAGQEARTAEVQALVRWDSSHAGIRTDPHPIELSFLEDVRSPSTRLGYLGLLPLSLALDGAIGIAGIAISPLALLTHGSPAPSAEELEAGLARRCGCLTREGGGEAYTRWSCYDPLL